MSLAPGDRLGPYEIIGALGAGGMGEVYRARDSRLNRDVAVKTLPGAFANDPNRMARFTREAQVLAALNHPNIAAIYGIEEGALVMELVEGATLAERIGQGPIPPGEALAIARQVADALEAAHEKSIVHRDLKPANIKVTPEGKVKVLDFGLAKAFEADPAATSAGLMNSPTLTLEATRAGMILGTAGYMSPEQARGKPADKRADIWSFGVVLYEMLTGRVTFGGETVSDTLAAVLRADIEWNRLPPDTPPGMRRLLRHCLERDPKKRLRDIGDAWLDVEETEHATAPPVPQPRHRRFYAIVAAAVLASAGLGWLLHTAPTPAPRPVTRWSTTLPAINSLTGIALSRDGKRLGYVDGTSQRITVRVLDQFEGKSMPGTENGFLPVFSPDGQWMLYWAQNKLKKMPVTGGSSITLCDASQPGGDWGDDETIVFTGSKGLMRVPAVGGTPQQLTTADASKGEVHAWPQFLPGQQAVLFTIAAGNSPENKLFAILDLKTGATRTIGNGGIMARYLPTGHVAFVRAGTLFALPFDARRLAVTGGEAPVVEGIFSVTSLGFADYAVADSGLLVYLSGSSANATSNLEWTDRKGVGQVLNAPAQNYSQLRVSPDGERIAVVISKPTSPDADIYIYDLTRGTLGRRTFGGLNNNPIWTPDGKRVTFFSMIDGKRGIYWTPADGSGKPELLLPLERAGAPTSWTADGRLLFYQERDVQQNLHIWTFPVGGSGNKPTPFLPGPFTESSAHISPDGRWVAYSATESASGNPQIYVQPYPGPGGKFQISSDGGNSVRWSRDGKELFYRNQTTGQMYVVEVQTGQTFQAGNAQLMFARVGPPNWDVSPDGKRFLFTKYADTLGVGRQIMAVTDWFEEVRRIAPAKK